MPRAHQSKVRTPEFEPWYDLRAQALNHHDIIPYTDAMDNGKPWKYFSNWIP